MKRILEHKILLFGAGADLLILICALIAGANPLMALVFMAWADTVLYSLADIEHRPMLLMFCITFFIFLMGRNLLEEFFRYRVEDFSEAVLNHTYLCLLLALISLWGVYAAIDRLPRRKVTGRISRAKPAYTEHVKMLSKLVFAVSFVFAVIYRIVVLVFVSTHGYFAYYTDFPVLLNQNLLLYAVSKLESVLPIAFCIFLAAMPAKREFFPIAALYCVYLALTLGGGNRAPFLLGLFLIVFYLIFRSGVEPQEGWFRRKYLIWFGIGCVVLALLSYVFGVIRDGGSMAGVSASDSFFEFFYSQGVSINVLKRGYLCQEEIPKGYIYSFEFVRSGLIARLFGIPIYHGNTVEHALFGGSFAHALGYVVLGEQYLAGRGLGTSYLAELYYDFGYLGIILGNAVYAAAIHVTDKAKNSGLLLRACCFSVFTSFLWAPRGNFSSMITALISPVSLAVFLFIFGGARLWMWIIGRSKKGGSRKA